MSELCKRIVVEKNSELFDQLIKELNELLELKHKRIRSTPDKVD